MMMMGMSMMMMLMARMVKILRDFERGSVKYKTNITTIYVTHRCTRGDRVEDKPSIRIKSCIACKPSRASLTVIFIYFLRYEIEKKLRAV